MYMFMYMYYKTVLIILQIVYSNLSPSRCIALTYRLAQPPKPWAERLVRWLYQLSWHSSAFFISFRFNSFQGLKLPVLTGFGG